MVSRLQALSDWLHTHEGRKIFRYTMVSVISTAVSLFVIALVYGVLHLWGEVESTIFGNAVATFPSYWLNRKWAWGKHGRSHFMKEVVPFWVMAALGIAFSIVGAALARHYAIKYNLDHFETTLLVLAANVFSFAIFWVAKMLVFNRLFRTELDEFDERLTQEEREVSEDVKPH
ncbi:MAG: GtrA family protein [Acidimicrobiales bacterium]